MQRQVKLLENEKVVNEEPPTTQSLNVKTKLNSAIYHDLNTKKTLEKTSEEHRKVALVSESIKAQKSSFTQTSISSKSIRYSGNDLDSIKCFQRKGANLYTKG